MNRWTWAHLALLVAQMGALLWVGHLTSFARGFPLDDAWIHQVVGRTFAETGVLGYSAERFGSAATSLTWAFLVGLNHAWLGIEPALYTFAVSAVLLLATGQLWLAMLRRDGAPLPVALGAAVFGATASNFVWFAFSGMESVLLVFLSTLALWWWTEPGERPRLRAIGTGIALALLFLTRPEAAALFGVLLLVLPWTGRSPRDLVAAALPCAASMLAYAAAMASVTGDARPSTLEGRRAMWFQDAPVASALELGERMLWTWAKRLSAHTMTIGSPSFAFWVLLGLALGGILVLARRRWVRFGALAAWGLVHLGVYLVLLPTPGHGGRYQPLTPALFLALAWVGAWSSVSSATFLAGLQSRTKNAVVLVAAVAFAISSARSLDRWSEAHRDAVQHVWDTEVGMGRAVAALPSTARVASFDIGGIGYFAGREVTDLGALVDPTLSSLLRDANAWPELDERNIDYIVVPEGYAHEFPDPWNFYWRLGLHKRPPGSLAKVRALFSEQSLWKRGLEATLHGAPTQVLYRVERPR